MGVLSAEFARVCDALDVHGGSLSTPRATPTIHTDGPPAVRFRPKLSAVSLSRAAWVKRCWLRSIGRNLPGLGAEREGNTQ